nr:OmpA family protein [uncultured Sphaerochaeta sp.]
MLKKIFLISLLIPALLLCQENDDPFHEIDEKIITLKSNNAQVLARDSYEDGIKTYNLVLEDYNSGYSLDELRRDIDEVKKLLARADRISTSSKEYFSGIIEKRENGLSIKADSVCEEYWQEAEEYLFDSIDEFADEDTLDADEYKNYADSLFTLSIDYTNKIHEVSDNWEPEINAISQNANLLAPIDFNEARVYKLLFIDAIRDGEDPEKIESLKNMAEEKFRSSIVNADNARAACSSLLEAREFALKKKTFLYSPEYWQAAEDKFSRTCEQFNNRDNDYWDSAVESEELYIESSRQTLRNYYLHSIDKAVEEARNNNADIYAPKTFAKSEAVREEVISRIETYGDYNDEIYDLAQNSIYNAQHANYISNLLQKFEEEDKTDEDIILASEKYLAEIANFVFVPAKFDEGYEATTQAILDVIRNGNITAINDSEITTTDTPDSPGLTDTEPLNYDNLEYYSQDTYISMLFSSNEAEIINEDDRMIIRLTGLVFPAASSRLEQRDYPLLDKVVRALVHFPDSPVTVEAYTDSRAAHSFNLTLSQERADAVAKYLSSKVSNDIESTGYGETNLIADDSTEEGRQKNRRVEIVVNKEEN